MCCARSMRDPLCPPPFAPSLVGRLVSPLTAHDAVEGAQVLGEATDQDLASDQALGLAPLQD